MLIVLLMVVVAGIILVKKIMKIRRDKLGRLIGITEEIPVSIIVFNSEGILSYCNKAAAELLYHKFILNTGENFLDMLSRFGMHGWLEIIEAFLDNNEKETLKELHLSGELYTRSILTVLKKTGNTDNNFRIYLTAVDISDYRKAKSEDNAILLNTPVY